VSPVIESESPVSGSVSFERTNTLTAVFLLVAAESLFAVGVSFTQLTVNEPVAVFESDPLASTAW
jgi:hypothetical protein